MDNKMNEPVKWTMEMEELLIDLVKSRACLWNHCLPPPEKTGEKIKISWDEVNNILKKTFNINSVQCSPISISKKWKLLLDYFWRKQRKKQVSTSSGDEKTEGIWKHEKRMMFLKDTLTVPVSNGDDNEKDDEKKLERIYRRKPKRKRTENSEKNELTETIVLVESDQSEVFSSAGLSIAPVENKPTLLSSVLNAIELTMAEFPQDVLQDTLFKIYAIVDETRRSIQNTKKNES